MTINIRKLRDEDYLEVKNLEKLFLKEAKLDSGGSISEDRRMEEDYVIIEGDKIIGFCCMLKNYTNKMQIVLEECYILKEFRGRGFGRSLIEYSLKNAREKYTRIILVTTNKGLVGFYSRFGFKETGKSEGIFVEMAMNIG